MKTWKMVPRLLALLVFASPYARAEDGGVHQRTSSVRHCGGHLSPARTRSARLRRLSPRELQSLEDRMAGIKAWYERGLLEGVAWNLEEEAKLYIEYVDFACHLKRLAETHPEDHNVGPLLTRTIPYVRLAFDNAVARGDQRERRRLAELLRAMGQAASEIGRRMVREWDAALDY